MDFSTVLLTSKSNFLNQKLHFSFQKTYWTTNSVVVERIPSSNLWKRQKCYASCVRKEKFKNIQHFSTVWGNCGNFSITKLHFTSQTTLLTNVAWNREQSVNFGNFVIFGRNLSLLFIQKLCLFLHISFPDNEVFCFLNVLNIRRHQIYQTIESKIA